MKARVLVAGAGLAGMSLALDLARSGMDVTLLERRSTPGGALCRVQTALGPADNSIHLHLAAFRRCLRRLEELGTRQLLVRPDGGMRITPITGRPLRLEGRPFLDGLRLLARPGLLFGLGRSLRRLLRELPAEEEDFGSMMNRIGLVAGSPTGSFVREWALSVFNAPAELLAATLVCSTLRELAAQPDAMTPLVPRAGLDQLWISPMRKVLIDAGVRLEEQMALERIEWESGRIVAARAGTRRFPCDRLVWAGPPGALGRVEGTDGLVPRMPARSQGRHIVNLLFETKSSLLPAAPMRGWFGRPWQWLFASGERRVTLVASGWDDRMLDRREGAIDEARRMLKAVGVEPGEHALIVQRHATHLQSPAFEISRPGARSPSSCLFYSGAWLNTGLPLSMESALAGAALCGRELLSNPS